MKIGVPAEVKDQEFRVALTPAGVHELTRAGHKVYIERGAGLGSSITDTDFQRAGATTLGRVEDVWGEGDLMLKVKEPIEQEYSRLRVNIHVPELAGITNPQWTW